MNKIDWEQLKLEAKERERLSVKEDKWTSRIVKIILIILAISIISVVGGGYWYFKQSLSPVNPNNKTTVEVMVPIGSTSRDIADILKKNGIIKNADIFRYYMRSKNVSDLKAGTYEFNQAMDVDAVIKQLESGGKPIQEDVDTKITVIEGMQLKEIAELVAKNTPITAETFMSVVNDEAFIKTLINKYPSLLKGILEVEGLRYRLEGYLFPATYDYVAGMTAQEIITKMVEAANSRYQQVRKLVDEHWLTYHQILSLASIVEREGVTTEDRKLIAAVFFNRMEAGMALQSDITVLYALDKHKEFVTYDDLEVDSPYNLYKNKGITPGPVNSPSLDAIKAVLEPTWNEYYYFVADLDTGDIYYSSTLEEHEALVEKYVNKRQSRRNESGESTTSQETTNESEAVDETAE
ncbi:endolytic transglycosylase MltG [Tuanshanicoccus lijuaniae]|uniref:endolytic transglycosylase MltG n=1 Tax=Aerococcaceae bacterium zg-1292 TaxID=2774330 RepID=UPI001BD82A2F|nr:endolytic transglycosylase MltG [Aerococcaceae bacterium zg-BR9]MBF6977926.1 endolytic transglycosylase MltG [Aerococcaceae bacterium zg-BR22]MBS4455873.1 endolytic transglycosylase MltG [Aerococcaceae bacterium zg-A91]MBS4457589.1 endolytic transglycosylase MltG [Aerococcaceae bacterium zg-BR33]